MIDVVCPENNEKELAEMAVKLGFDKIVFLYDKTKPAKYSAEKIKVFQAVFLSPQKLNIARSKNLLAFCKGNEQAREAIERSFDAVVSLEDYQGQDHLHFRNSGLNHVLCRMASKNNVKICFSFSDVLNSLKRNILFGRIIQNIRFCRKYKTQIILGSFAKTPYEMRSHFELRAFFETLGMTSKESNEALNWI